MSPYNAKYFKQSTKLICKQFSQKGRILQYMILAWLSTQPTQLVLRTSLAQPCIQACCTLDQANARLVSYQDPYVLLRSRPHMQDCVSNLH